MVFLRSSDDAFMKRHPKEGSNDERHDGHGLVFDGDLHPGHGGIGERRALRRELVDSGQQSGLE
jgi:hypothetical protein